MGMSGGCGLCAGGFVLCECMHTKCIIILL